ncbi:gas vesicle structural protein GvpA [Streptomyces sp. NPDC087908]|uniref:gas vesicle structural protein GvpA n=1 Tax=unclassified Streptomyces TaxID=2593676 RepID=UPI0011CDE690|nr:gas vesicle structural protein GvpA [Streptomyces sp. adm13(2018)]TXS21901.1 gas vesicle structural protein GvpA [Streptomyces sp. adm13(2018)]
MTMVPQSGGSAVGRGGGASTGSLYDVLELILDRGLVIDIFVRVSLVGIEILKIDARIVVASVDTYLRFAEACNRLDLEAGRKAPAQLPEVVGGMMEGGAHGKSKGALTGAVEAVTESLTGKSRDDEEPDEEPEEEEAEQAAPRRRRPPSRRTTRREKE